MSRAIAVFLLFLLCIVSAHAQTEPERVRIQGSQTLGARLVPAVAEAWLRDIGYGDIRREEPSPARTELHAHRDGQPLVVEIVGSSSAQGFAGLVDGNAQIAMMTRRPTPAELDAGWQLGNLASHDQEFVVALDGVAIVVHRANPIARLDLTRLRQVLSGEVRDWGALGAGSGPVRLHLVAGANSARDLIDERVMRGARYAPATSHADGPALLRAIAADPSAIGFVTLRQRLGNGVRPVAIAEGGRAIAPTRLAVQSEDYPLVRRMYLYGSQMMGALSRSFALYAMGRHGQEAVARAGHLSVMLRPGHRPTSLLGPEAYRNLVRGAERLPLSLRFNLIGQNDSGVAASVYDSRAVRDLDRLAAFMRLPTNRGRRLLVIGFADVEEPVATSLMMSHDRADLVAQELIARGIAVERVRGMGGALPLAVSSDGSPTRYRNERVELWLR